MPRIRRRAKERSPMLRFGNCLLALVIAWSLVLPALAGEIHNAARDGKLDEVKRLLEEDPGLLDAKDELGFTPLGWACARNHTDVARYLIERGAAVNARSSSLPTPLHIAALRGNLELVELLLTKGADAEARTQIGETVLHWGVKGGNKDVVNTLLAHKVRINARDNNGNAALLWAAASGASEIVDMLVANGANVNEKNNRGSTPLSVARREGFQKVADYLVAHGARAGKQDLSLPKGDYFGQPPPGPTPKMFAPGIVSTERDQLNAVFTPDGKEFFFAVMEQGRGHRMYHMVQTEGTWSRPAPVPFATASGSDVDMFVTHDGQRLFFCSTRPAPGRSTAQRDSDIYMVARTTSSWGEPESLGEQVNSEQNDYYPTLTRQGVLYFSSHRAGGLGQNDIYRSRFVNGRYQQPENLGPGVNTPHREFDPFIAPDESYLVFSSNRPGGFGEADLYISFRQEDGRWSTPQNMGATINSSASDFTPMLSPDGKYFFFTSGRAGVTDLYWVDATVIRNMRPDHAPSKNTTVQEETLMLEKLLAIENGAMERWRNGDPMGWTEISAPEVTYVDPGLAKPIDGLEEYTEYLRQFIGKIKYDVSEFIKPSVAVHGDVAVLTYNYFDAKKAPDGSLVNPTHWNTTEVYARLDGKWKIIHTHWSYVRQKLPERLEVPIPVALAPMKYDGGLGELMALEAAAMERWRKGDPWGFVEISAPDVTYFDTGTSNRLDGLAALEAEYAKRRGRIRYDVMEFVAPKAQVHGDVAVLTYRFFSTRLNADGSIAQRTPWNCTEVFARINGKWKIIHTHWSFINGQQTTENPTPD